MRILALLIATALLANGANCVYGQSENEKDALVKRLNAQFILTRMTADGTDVVKGGSIVTLHKDGLQLCSIEAKLPLPNSYKQGRLSAGKFGWSMAMGLAQPQTPTANIPLRTFVPDEKVWITAFGVEKSGVIFKIYSDSYQDVRYYGQLEFPFSKKSMPPVDDLLKTIAEVLTADAPSDNQQSTTPPPDQGQSSSSQTISGQYSLKQTGAHLSLVPDGSFILTASNGDQRPGHFTVNGNRLALTYAATGRTGYFTIQGDQLLAETGLAWIRQGDAPQPASPPEQPVQPMQAIAPPPPPSDDPPPPPPTVSLGQTMNQVIGILGQPKSVARAAAKTIFTYTSLKVVFVNGKVSDVE